MELDYTPVIWDILFNEKLEELPDPNKPENTAHISAVKKAEVEQLKSFMQGVGKPLVSKWEKKIKKDLLGVVSHPDVNKCNCGACVKIREVRFLLNLLMEAKQTLNLG